MCRAAIKRAIVRLTLAGALRIPFADALVRRLRLQGA